MWQCVEIGAGMHGAATCALLLRVYVCACVRVHVCMRVCAHASFQSM